MVEFIKKKSIIFAHIYSGLNRAYMDDLGIRMV